MTSEQITATAGAFWASAVAARCRFDAQAAHLTLTQALPIYLRQTGVMLTPADDERVFRAALNSWPADDLARWRGDDAGR